MIGASVRITRPSTILWRKGRLPILVRYSPVQQQSLSRLAQRLKRSRSPNQSDHQSRDDDDDAETANSHQEEQEPLKTSTRIEANDAGETPDDKGPVVKWWNQLTPWSKERKLADPDNPDPFDDTGIVKRLKQEIDKLDAELKEMENAPLAPLMKRLSPEDRKDLEEDWKKASEIGDQDMKKLEEYRPRLKIEWTLPPEHKSYLKDLNDHLQEALLSFKSYAVRRTLWRSYARCKTFLPPFSHLIPGEAWVALFRAQMEAANCDDPHWASHLITLVEDMRATGKRLMPDWIVFYIEALRFEDQIGDAVREWEALKRYVGNNIRLMAEFELLGVRLFTSQGDLATAERIASEHLESNSESEARILLPIMETWMERGDEIGMRHAWALYLSIKMQLGSDITMDDYDGICARFLNCGRTDLALAVFKDMILTGRESGHDSVALFQRYQRNLKDLSDRTSKMPQLNEIYLTSLTVVPKKFENKFFYAIWLRKLLLLREADAAAAVVELMYERNVRPDAKHLNGLLGVWIRSSSEAGHSKAEQIGWSMIGQRLAFVRGRAPADAGDINAFISKVYEEGLTVEPASHHKRAIPAATVETYGLLLQYYARRSRYKDIQMLDEALKLGQMQPNIYWNNHLMWMLCHKHKFGSVWNFFIHKFGDQVLPDVDTFSCLWKSQKNHLHHSKATTTTVEDFPPPRAMFRLFFDARIGEKPDRELYEDILTCFMRSQDPVGAMVAIHALKDRYDLQPNKNTTKSIFNLAAREIVQPIKAKAQGYTGHRTRSLQMTRSKVATNELLQAVQQERSERMATAGFDDADLLESELQWKEWLAMTVDFLKHLAQVIMQETNVDGKVKKAKSEMGVTGVSVEDYLRSEYRV